MNKDGTNGSGGPRRARTTKRTAAAPKPAPQEIARDVKGRWPKGQSGNPTGNPPGPYFMDEVRKQLGNGKTLAEIVKKYLEAAKAGDTKTIMDLADRLDGKALQRAEVGVTDRGPVLVRDQDFDENGEVEDKVVNRIKAELDRE